MVNAVLVNKGLNDSCTKDSTDGFSVRDDLVFACIPIGLVVKQDCWGGLMRNLAGERECA